MTLLFQGMFAHLRHILIEPHFEAATATGDNASSQGIRLLWIRGSPRARRRQCANIALESRLARETREPSQPILSASFLLPILIIHTSTQVGYGRARLLRFYGRCSSSSRSTRSAVLVRIGGIIQWRCLHSTRRIGAEGWSVLGTPGRANTVMRGQADKSHEGQARHGHRQAFVVGRHADKRANHAKLRSTTQRRGSA